MSDNDFIESSCLTCSVCEHRLKNPALLPCLHVFCLACLKATSEGKSRDTFSCPLCVSEKTGSCTFPSRPWNSFQTVLEEEQGREALQRRMSELPGKNMLVDSDDEEDESDQTGSNLRRPPVDPFPCPSHPGKLVDQFCDKCQTLVCPKCVQSFHRRCQHFSSLVEAVASKRPVFESLHRQMAANLVQCQTLQELEKVRLEEAEKMKSKLMDDITSHSYQLICQIKDKEKALRDEVNRRTEEMKKEADQRQRAAANLARALSKQLDLLDVSFCVNGEAELLPFLSSLPSQIEWNNHLLENNTVSGPDCKLVFAKDENLVHSLTQSPLGSLQITTDQNGRLGGDKKLAQTNQDRKVDLTLALMTSFHGSCRDDVTEPLLTDLVLLPNGDVILTDRDNKSVKKFKPCGRLLTRVQLGAIPSRITIVSHGRAAVSVMDKKQIYFLSLLGTVRVLESVKVKKIYPFITWLEKGFFVSATNQCDCIDLLNERGEFIQNLYSQKSDRVAICRPLYLNQASPYCHLRNNGSHKQDNGTKHQECQAPIKSSTDTNFLVSDSGKKNLSKLDQDGKMTLLLKSSEQLTLECPLGLTVHETGLTLLCDRDRDVVLMLDKNGHLLKELLTSQVGLVKPCGIYSGYKGDVALTQVDGMVKIYKSNIQYC